MPVLWEERPGQQSASTRIGEAAREGGKPERTDRSHLEAFSGTHKMDVHIPLGAAREAGGGTLSLAVANCGHVT